MIDLHFLAAATEPIRRLLPVALSDTTAIIVLIIGLALIFAGRRIIKALAFLAVGLAVGAIGATYGAIVLGIFGLLIGGILGFIVGGLISLLLLPLGIGIGVGIIAYNITQSLAHIYVLSIIIGAIFFVVGIVLSSKILALATAIFGGLLLFNALIYFHLTTIEAGLIAIVLGAIGFWVQGGFSGQRGMEPTKAVPAPAPPSSKYCSKCGTSMPITSQYCPSCGVKQ